MRARLVVCVATATAVATAAGPARGDCALLAAGWQDATVASCLACHATSAEVAHPTGMDYAAAAQASARGPSPLRPASDVVARGVLLPAGEVRCVTCHAPTSPWKDHLALPPGATPRPAVTLADPSTYEASSALPAPAPGDAVTPTPLCTACHAYD